MARVLVVDDSDFIKDTLQEILEMCGHTVIAKASNGMQAFSEFEKHKPDLVTMDITMPEMDGIMTVKRIIGNYPAAKIIIVSAINNREMVFDALQSGAHHYILKPFSFHDVHKAVNSVLNEDICSNLKE